MFHLTPVLQEIAAIQTKCEAAQTELRKTQQLLRQSERQLTKAYMNRKESGSTSQHLQVAIQPYSCLSYFTMPAANQLPRNAGF